MSGIVDRVGKLPPDVLQQSVLRWTGAPRPEVRVGPGLGEDAAVIDWPAGRRLVVTSDPIVGASNGAGRYLVQVNANDIACKGGDPAFLVVTLIVPVKLGRNWASEVMEQVDQACRELNVAVVGGHTELTDRYDWPVIVGTMIGTTEWDLQAGRIRPGDRLIITKHLGLEGMAILASDRPDLLKPSMTSEEIAQTADWRGRLSVLPESKILRSRAHFMHDPTEGGFLGGLTEISRLGGLAVDLDWDALPLHPLTRRAADALGFDPLKLISSGALLAVVPENDAAELMGELKRSGIEAALVGEVTEGTNNWEPSADEELWGLLVRA